MQIRNVPLLLVIVLMFTFASCNPDGQPANPGGGQQTQTEPRATGPMPDGAFKAVITVPDAPAKLKPGQKLTLNIKIKNAGNTAWPAHGRATDGFFQVNLGDRWFDSHDVLLEKHPYVRSGLPADLQPNAEVEVPLEITAPNSPGDYTLQIDMVQEMVAWFADKGNPPPKFKVKVGG